ncbi:MAG: sulfotransferase domain-containing protein [Cyanobacteria bacterium P01_D01_bin.14]
MVKSPIGNSRSKRKRSVIIAGYPKSGNTWITRLTAELLQCPVSGFWRDSRDRQEIACEGENRISTFECYKSHHPLRVFKGRLKKAKDFHVIHVVRDPRDISVSGSNFFLLEKDFLIKTKHLLDHFSRSGKLYETLIRHLKRTSIDRSLYTHTGPDRIDKMIETLIDGNEDFCHWLIPWKTYVNPYLDSEVLSVKYEDMLRDPFRECLRILDYIGVHKNEAEILEAIKKQSFDQLKKKYSESNDSRRSSFLNVGKSEQWRAQLNKRQKDRFIVFLKELEHLNYPLK